MDVTKRYTYSGIHLFRTLISTGSRTCIYSIMVTLLTLISFSSSLYGQSFAIIGDYGSEGTNEEDVANLVKSWNPDFVITAGDNNYSDGEASTIDPNIGQYYHEFIYPYLGSYGPGATTNRFFPTLGNHDVRTDNG
ncbi:metallophosphoesterase, partial [candidate division TA06 bacterium]|nr:metallophosphoesterase [candidate division TA06 bacterium]